MPGLLTLALAGALALAPAGASTASATTALDEASATTPAADGAAGTAAPDEASRTAAPAATDLPHGLRSVTELLEADGTLREGAPDGPVDVSGWTMTTAPDGSPRFVAEDAAADASSAALAVAGDTSWSTTFGAATAGMGLTAVTVSGTNIYVGGTVTDLASTAEGTYQHVARWDGKAWQRLGTGIDGEVMTIAVNGTDVYVGGDFERAGSVAANDLARWNGSAWSAVAGGVTNPAADYDEAVRALATNGKKLYVGGTFTKAGTVSARSLAAYDLTAKTWSAVGAGLYRCASCGVGDPGAVNALLLDGTKLYVGGNFDKAGTRTTMSLASVDTATGTWTAYGKGIHTEDGYKGVVESLALDPATRALYVGGSFTRANGVTTMNLAKLAGTTFSSVGKVTFYGDKYATVQSVAFSGGKLYIGGTFTEIDGVKRSNWAVRSGTTWSTPGGGLDDVVVAMAPKDSGVVVLGDFVTAGTLRMNRAGIWTGTAWQTFGQGVSTTAYGNGDVHAIVPDGSGAYVAGIFNQVGQKPARSIARWTGSSWDTMAGGVTTSIGDAEVHAMVKVGTDLYVAGEFSKAGGVAVRNIARWNGTSWSALGAGLDGEVYALHVLNGKLYAGGEFVNSGTQHLGGVGAWDLTAKKWLPLGNHPQYSDDVRALSSVAGQYLVIGGHFHRFYAGGMPAVEGLYGMTMFDTKDVTGSDVLDGYYLLEGVSWAGGPGGVRTLKVIGGDLYVGGQFDRAGIMTQGPGTSSGFAAKHLVVCGSAPPAPGARWAARATGSTPWPPRAASWSSAGTSCPSAAGRRPAWRSTTRRRAPTPPGAAASARAAAASGR
ncbi:hypothetical protein [Cellulomonas marina]|uniref:hypothetical protein n=1 Tax=Cellulomonas marina TaxID=988821 RepID=UPI000B7F867F|nr:hypothetical protein [Cellulomonas marina]GIG28407.1 hypothetical protein Cma02nite_10070 [Cellulomonas marina]